jgi:hypothetical protein
MDKAEPYNEIQRLTEIERAASGKPSHSKMDAAFCARMHAAIAAGLDSAPTSVTTTPGTKNPKVRLGPNVSEQQQGNS